MNITDLPLDIADPRVQGVLTAKYGDTARGIRFHLRKNGQPWAPEGALQVVLTALKSDGTVLYNDCQAEGQTYLYAFTPQTASCPGPVRCELRLYLGERLLTSPRFDILVEDTLYHEGDTLDSTSEATALRSIATDMQALLEEITLAFHSGALNGPAGADGQPGADGLTPHIGENGNWHLGSQDTGVNAQGEEKWELLARFSIDEADACRVVAISQDTQGKPFSCRKLCLKSRTSAPADRKATAFQGWVCVNGTGSYSSGTLGYQVSYVNYPAYSRMENTFFYELFACGYHLFTANVARTYATAETSLYEIELAGQGDEENIFFGDFELWGVRV